MSPNQKLEYLPPHFSGHHCSLVLRGFAEILQMMPRSLPSPKGVEQMVALPPSSMFLLNTSPSCWSYSEFLFIYSINHVAICLLL